MTRNKTKTLKDKTKEQSWQRKQIHMGRRKRKNGMSIILTKHLNKAPFLQSTFKYQQCGGDSNLSRPSQKYPNRISPSKPTVSRHLVRTFRVSVGQHGVKSYTVIGYLFSAYLFINIIRYKNTKDKLSRTYKGISNDC